MGKSPNRKLNDTHRAFLVQQFACFSTPAEAADALKTAFDIVISPQGAQHYDVTSVSSKPSKKWAELYALAREAFIEDVQDSVPLAHRSVRIKKLAKAANAFEKQKNYLAMAKVLEAIAKEVGSVHTNKHEITGKDGGPIRYAEVGDMTDEQIVAELESYGIDPDQIHAAPKTTH